MNQKMLFTLWGSLFVLCAGLGFLPQSSGFLQVVLVVLAVAFFLPPMLLLRRSRQTGDRRTVALIRNLAIASLVLSVVMIIANFFSIGASETMGNLLNSVLLIVSTPMACGRYWALSLFLWACLMIAAGKELKTM